ncbi:MAG: hypothetical protein LH632_06870 [Rhodoferax sp.]|nr:hypothetical protein [Rhodoferax sp.]
MGTKRRLWPMGGLLPGVDAWHAGPAAPIACVHDAAQRHFATLRPFILP